MGKFEVKAAKSGYVFNLKAGNGQVIATSQTYKGKKSCLAGVESVRKNCAVAVEDQTVEGFETLKNPKYEVYADKAGAYRFRLKASNGEIVVTGQGYKAKKSCMNGIASIAKNAPEAEVVEIEE